MAGLHFSLSSRRELPYGRPPLLPLWPPCHLPIPRQMAARWRSQRAFLFSRCGG
jgi:hypothetical protein